METSEGYQIAKALEAHRALGKWSAYPLVASRWINRLPAAERTQLRALIVRCADRPLITKADATPAEQALLRRLYEHLAVTVRVVERTTAEEAQVEHRGPS